LRYNIASLKQTFCPVISFKIQIKTLYMRKLSFFLCLWLIFLGSLSGQVVNTGTLKIFSEFDSFEVYLDEVKVGDNIQQIDSVLQGSRYLKILVDNVAVYSELIEINPNAVTSILVKNSGQVAEKIMESKVDERLEFQNNKLDIILTSNSVTQTQGYSNLFPGYYSYWGFSSSVSNTTQISDWKIIQGGVKEISERQFADLTKDDPVIQAIAKNDAKYLKLNNIGAFTFLVSFIPATLILVDILVDKPFLHKSPEHPDWEAYVFTGGVLGSLVGYGIINMSGNTHPAHYYSVDDAARSAQEYNQELKKRLGLPESYDLK